MHTGRGNLKTEWYIKYNIKVDLKETGTDDVEWVDLAYKRDKEHTVTHVVTNVFSFH
jgi:hypothetical protein